MDCKISLINSSFMVVVVGWLSAYLEVVPVVLDEPLLDCQLCLDAFHCCRVISDIRLRLMH